jgi:glutamate formiminotransferase
VLECVPNVSEGRDDAVLEHLVDACGPALLDVHRDRDHHRSVFTLAGTDDAATELAVRRLASAVAMNIEVTGHEGVHPRLGALDVVPFVALSPEARPRAVLAAHAFATWVAAELTVPVFFYGDADVERRSLPDARRHAFTTRAPDLGPTSPHPRLGAVVVGTRPVMIAVNCVLDTDDLAPARRVAHEIRERDGGLPGVRALAFLLPSVQRVQVSLNLVDLERTGLQDACDAVRAAAEREGARITAVELVGLLPASELARCDGAFLEWAQIGPTQTIEDRLGRQARAARRDA